MKKFLKDKKGVTLVALVVTVIILIILAAITINLTIGENGIITTAKQAGKNYQEATNTEQNILADFWSGAEETIGSAESVQNSRGVGNAVASEILEGRTAYVNGNVVTGTMKNLSRSTVQASKVTSDEDNVYLSISEAGFYDTDSKISVEKSEVATTIVSAEQIAAGKTVAGITGTYTSDATATAADIASGKTAYVNGSEITGTYVAKEFVSGSVTTSTSYNYANGVKSFSVSTGYKGYSHCVASCAMGSIMMNEGNWYGFSLDYSYNSSNGTITFKWNDSAGAIKGLSGKQTVKFVLWN